MNFKKLLTPPIQYGRIFVIAKEFDKDKNVKENLSKSERNAISEMIKQLERALKG